MNSHTMLAEVERLDGLLTGLLDRMGKRGAVEHYPEASQMKGALETLSSVLSDEVNGNDDSLPRLKVTRWHNPPEDADREALRKAFPRMYSPKADAAWERYKRGEPEHFGPPLMGWMKPGGRPDNSVPAGNNEED